MFWEELDFREVSWASPHSCSLAGACLALPGPCSLAPNLEVVSITCLLYLEALLCIVRQQDKWRRIDSLNLSLPCSLLALPHFCVLNCLCPPMLWGATPLLSEDQRSHLAYQYRGNSILSCFPRLSFRDWCFHSGSGFIFVLFFFLIFFFLLLPVSEILRDLPLDFLFFMFYLIS